MIQRWFATKALVIVLLGVFTFGCTTHDIAVSQPSSALVSPTHLKLATWNIEHLAYPASQGCKARTQADIRALQRYVTEVNADIIALQEVASEQALTQIFPSGQWQLFISQRPDSERYECRESGQLSTQQKVAFAVKKGVDVLNVRQLHQLGLNNPGLRHGLEISVVTPLGKTNLLNVHMKSGCFVDDVRQSNKPACETYARQVPLVLQWIETNSQLTTPFILLGDFNHRLSSQQNRFAKQIRESVDDISIVTDKLIGCHPRYPAPIDHIVIGNARADSIRQSATVHYFEKMNEQDMLSDHCAISVELSSND